jgi:hypothetical protein
LYLNCNVQIYQDELGCEFVTDDVMDFSVTYWDRRPLDHKLSLVIVNLLTNDIDILFV